MFVSEILLEKEDKTAQLGQRIINLLKKTPSVNSPIAQYKNDPNQVHMTARSNFRSWCKMTPFCTKHPYAEIKIGSTGNVFLIPYLYIMQAMHISAAL